MRKKVLSSALVRPSNQFLYMCLLECGHVQAANSATKNRIFRHVNCTRCLMGDYDQRTKNILHQSGGKRREGLTPHQEIALEEWRQRLGWVEPEPVIVEELPKLTEEERWAQVAGKLLLTEEQKRERWSLHNPQGS